MDTFLIGFLSALVVIFMIAGVVGLVYVGKLRTKINLMDNVMTNEFTSLHQRIDNEVREIRSWVEGEFANIYRRFDEENGFINHRVDLEVKELQSSIDSRMNKLENKIVK